MSPDLCEICQKFDLRKLFLDSAAQNATSAKGAISGYKNVDLQRLDVNFCVLIWTTRSKKEHDITVDKWLDETGQGQIFIGTGSSSVTKRESPYVLVSQRPANSSPRNLCNLEVFAAADSTANRESPFVGRPIFAQSNSPECYKLAKEWLRVCSRDHKDCGPIKTRCPTRLIDVGSSDTNPFLDENPNRGDVEWSTYQSLKSGIPVEDFPATLRDAVLTTRELGLKYVWIDALCIRQDSADDWKAEAGRMRDVYAGATVTIVAANSTSTSAGMHFPRPENVQASARCKLPWDTNTSVSLRLVSHISRQAAKSSSWFTRGWTFQEGLLSPRALSYGRDQMTWECAYHTEDESGHIGLLDQNYDSKDLLHKLRKKQTNRMSRAIQNLSLQSYTLLSEVNNCRAKLGFPSKRLAATGLNMQENWAWIPRNLTYMTDVLPALSGIAREFSMITKDTYISGMWKSYIIPSLLWNRRALGKMNKVSEYEIDNQFFTHVDWKKRGSYLAPSWSWASIDAGSAQLNPYPFADATVHQVAALVDLQLHHSGMDIFGPLEPDSALIMKGVLFPIHNLADYYWRFSDPPEPLPKFQERLGNDATEKIYSTGSWPALQEYIHEWINDADHASFEFEQQHVPHPNQKFGAFLLMYIEGVTEDNSSFNLDGSLAFLLVESTGNVENEYRRVGAIVVQRSKGYPTGKPIKTLSEAKKAEKRGEYSWTVPPVSQMEKLIAKLWQERPKEFPNGSTIRLV
ncbi:heterokaryon incompatibility protein [Botrytis cinerea]